MVCLWIVYPHSRTYIDQIIAHFIITAKIIDFIITVKIIPYTNKTMYKQNNVHAEQMFNKKQSINVQTAIDVRNDNYSAFLGCKMDLFQT